MSVLVTYASKHGATEEIAERIAGKLRQLGKDVEVRPVEAVELAGDLRRLEAVVIGSAVYFGSWMKEATAFVRANCEALAARPVWLFSSGPTGEAAPPDQPDQPDQPDPKQIAELNAAIRPQEHRMFGGELNHHKLSFPERMIIKGVKAPEGDFRDWDAIEAWSESIGRALAPNTPSTTTA